MEDETPLYRPIVVHHASSNVYEDDGVYAEIHTNAIPQVSSVRLYEETVDHANEHEEVPADFPSVVRAVGRAVSNPTHVEKSYNDSYVFVDQNSTNSSGYPLRVPVKVISDSGSGLVKTYFFGDTDDAREIVYRQADDAK